MGRGILAGGFWGLIVGLVLLLVSNQTLERQTLSFPRPEATPVEVPAGTEFNQARPETDPVLPESEAPPPSDTLTGVTPPDDTDQPPAFDTTALDVPEPSIEGPVGLGEVPDLAEDTDVEVTGPGPEPAEVPADVPGLTVPESPATAPETVTVTPADALTLEEEQDSEVGAALPAPERPAGSEPASDEQADALPETGSDAAPSDADEAAPAIAPTVDAPTLGTVGTGESSGLADTAMTDAGIEDVTPTQPVLPPTSDAPAEPETEAPAAAVVTEAEVETEEPVVDEEADLVAGLDSADGGETEIFVPESQSEFERATEADTAEAETSEEPVTDEVAPETAMTAPELAEQPEAEEPATESELAQVGTGDLPMVNRLPQIGDEAPAAEGLPAIRRLPGQADSEAALVPETDEAEEFDAAETAEPAPNDALGRNAMPFENVEGAPLIAVVLIHEEGTTALADDDIPEGVTIALRSGDANAAALARDYAAQGHEVVLIPSLPKGARPQDVEQALRVNFDTVPQAVAIMDNDGSGFQADREAIAQIVDVVIGSGHGLITFPRGLNTAHQRAERAGVPTGLIYRDLDGDGETPDQIARGLDRAAFSARQNDAVILVGRTDPATLATIRAWLLEPRDVRLAPVSATLSAE